LYGLYGLSDTFGDFSKKPSAEANACYSASTHVPGKISQILDTVSSAWLRRVVLGATRLGILLSAIGDVFSWPVARLAQQKQEIRQRMQSPA